ncbi:MAG: exonuclease SbcCD subunit D [Candidatus Bipolaricaulia bacterium]
MVTIKEPLKVLCTADLHLGRHPAKIPDAVDGTAFSPGSVWLSVVEKAIEVDVDVAVIAGDIVDRENSYFEAFGDFEAGVRKLSQSGIPLYVVSGNHDFNVVPDLVSSLTDQKIHQLGKNGEWGSVTVSSGDSPPVNIVGWSYPNRHIGYNPLEQLDEELGGDNPVIGLLHSEINKPESNYAPVSETALERAGFDGWVVGHAHNANLKSDRGKFRLVPGNPQPLDPTESGVHGPWVFSVDERGVTNVDQYPLASLSYENLTMDLGTAEKPEEVPAKFYSLTEDLLNEVDYNELRLLVLTLEFVGRTDIYEELEEKRNRIRKNLRRESGEVNIAVASIVNNTLPSINLEEIAKGNNPAAMVAELLINLDQREKDKVPERLMDKTRESLTDAYFANAYQVLRTQREIGPPDSDLIVTKLKRQGRVILDELLSQKNA